MLCLVVIVLYLCLCLCCVGCEQAVKVLLNSVPEHVQFDGVLEDLQAVRGVTSVHDLHIWGISSKTVSPPPNPTPLPLIFLCLVRAIAPRPRRG